jgi:hypothetical protein
LDYRRGNWSREAQQLLQVTQLEVKESK